jgi:cellulose synthase/poly-beta-1,6-N-acetylglucosamine synthase-like glycosyltransferase
MRRSALEAVGGWDQYMLAEDTDLTFRLLAMGWKVAYVNRAECYEEVVENWAARRKQVRRWALGHMQACVRHMRPLLANPNLGFWEKLDGVLLLSIYFVPPLTLLAWLVSAFILLVDPTLFPPSAAVFIGVATYFTVGNFAIFFEIGVAVALDGNSRRLRLLPFVFGGFMASLFTVTGAAFALLASRLKGESHVAWDKTPRFR